MNEQTFREDIFLLVGYLLTSARGLYDEPPGYGPFRLLDAATRLIEAVEKAELADPYLVDLRGTLNAERLGSSDDQALRATLDRLCLEYAAELRQRVSSPEVTTGVER
jgi:hypothetical protein